jgi:hypothetical protein
MSGDGGSARTPSIRIEEHCACFNVLPARTRADRMYDRGRTRNEPTRRGARILRANEGGTEHYRVILARRLLNQLEHHPNTRATLIG